MTRRRATEELALGALLWFGAGFAFASASCVCPPKAEDLLAVGFRSPAQTFRTFQTAVRADDPNLEYRCFSSGFVSRNRLSRLNYREFRDELRASQPFLRKGIVDAEVIESSTVGDALSDQPVRMVLESHGRTIQVDLVRDDFVELWIGETAAVDEHAAFRKHTGVQQDARGASWFFGQVALPAGRERSDITEVRVGREWKIDSLAVVEAPSRAPGARDENRLE